MALRITKELAQSLGIETKKSKYNAEKRTVDNIKFASKKEAAYYQKLVMLQKMKKIRYFLMQIPFRLQGGTKHLVDFMIVKLDGTLDYVEVKGRDLAMGKMKRKMTEDMYNIRIRVV